jgi:hypothetical protein
MLITIVIINNKSNTLNTLMNYTYHKYLKLDK